MGHGLRGRDSPFSAGMLSFGLPAGGFGSAGGGETGSGGRGSSGLDAMKDAGGLAGSLHPISASPT